MRCVASAHSTLAMIHKTSWGQSDSVTLNSACPLESFGNSRGLGLTSTDDPWGEAQVWDINMKLGWESFILPIGGRGLSQVSLVSTVSSALKPVLSS